MLNVVEQSLNKDKILLFVVKKWVQWELSAIEASFFRFIIKKKNDL